MLKRMKVLMAVCCVGIFVASVLSGCSCTATTNTPAPPVPPPPNATTGDVQTTFTRTTNVKAEDFTGLWEIRSFDIDDDVFSKLHPTEKDSNEAFWQIIDDHRVLHTCGSYYDIHADGTYDVWSGQLPEGADVYELVKTDEGKIDFTESDYDATLINKDNVAFGLMMDEGGQVITMTNVANNPGYSMVYSKCDYPVEDIVPMSALGDFALKARVNHVTETEVADGALIDLQEKDDGKIFVKLDMNKISFNWKYERPVIIIETCDKYPSGIAMNLDSSEKSDDGILTAEGTQIDIKDTYLSVDKVPDLTK